MTDYNGTIIEESLADISLLDDLNIESTKVEPVTDGHKTPWVTRWTMHSVSISPEYAQDMAQRLSHALDSRHPWYADFKTDQDHYIIFRDKMFHVTDRTSEEQYNEATRYGLTLGIPEYQLDFSQHIKEWKR